MISAPIFCVTFERIGRSHAVAPLDVQAGNAGDLAQAIYTYARPHLRSREVTVVLAPAEFAAAEAGGQGGGLIICGVAHVGGTFTLTHHGWGIGADRTVRQTTKGSPQR